MPRSSMRLLVVIIMLLIPSLAHAGSSSVSEKGFIITGAPGSVSTQRVRVTNTDAIAQAYEFSPFETLAASVNPSWFSLNPGESQDVVIRFRQPDESARTHVSLVARDVNQASPLTVANGIRIPVEFVTSQIAGASRPASLPRRMTGSATLAVPYWHIIIYGLDAMLMVTAAWLARSRTLVEHHGQNYKISFV